MDLTKALNYVSDGIVGLDVEWRVVYANSRAELLLRKRRSELIGAMWWDAFDYLRGTGVEQELKSAASGSDARRVRIFHPPLYAWHDVWAVPSPDGLLLTLRDTTDVARMRQQEAVREAVREIIDEAPVAISLMRGPEHRVELMNQFARQLLGGRDLEGLTVRGAIPEVEGQGLFEILDEVYTTGKPFEGKAIPVRFDRLGNGEMYEGYFDVVYQPILDVSGSISGVLSVSIEVTDQVKAREGR